MLSIVRTTALEILSEPLSLLVLLATLALAVFAPAFHYHQFGEATRMARDAGISSLLTGGSVIAVFGTIRNFRREIETRTFEMTLVHPVSRAGFFIAKTLGAVAAYLFFSLIVFCVMLTVVKGAAIGGEIARQTGGIARIWGPSLLAGVGVILIPLFVGAGRSFAGGRFVWPAFLTAGILSALAGCALVCIDVRLCVRLLSAAVPVTFLSLVLLTASAALSVRLKAHAASAAVGVLFLLLLPAAGNYCLADALSNGGTVPWGYVGLAALATAPAVLLFALVGIHLINGRDIA